MSASAVKITTVDRILDASLKLFNEQGFHRVPAMRVAEHLGISPGHLAYHFKNKTEILLALFPRMEKDMQDLMQIELPHVAPVSIERTLKMLKTFWNYRFFFIELPQIAPIDDRIMTSYITLEDRILDTMRRSLDKRITDGDMHPIPPPSTTELLAKNTWGTWLDWIRREQLRNPGQQTPSAASVYEVMLRGYSIVQPFLTPDFLEEAISSLKKRLEKVEQEAQGKVPEIPAAPTKKRRKTATSPA